MRDSDPNGKLLCAGEEVRLLLPMTGGGVPASGKEQRGVIKRVIRADEQAVYELEVRGRFGGVRTCCCRHDQVERVVYRSVGV